MWEVIGNKRRESLNVNYIILLVGILICTMEDIRRHMISLTFVILWTLILCGMQIYQGDLSVGIVVGAVVTVAIASAISRCSGGQLGMGDGFMFGMTAMGLGVIRNLYMLAYCFLSVFVVAIILLVIFRKGKDTRIPLAPFILLGSILVIF